MRQLRKLVEVDVDDLLDRWWDTCLRHDHELVGSELDDRSHLPCATFMCENLFTWEWWELDPCCRALGVVAHRVRSDVVTC